MEFFVLLEEEAAPVVSTSPTEPVGPPPPKPGTDEWVYVEEKIDPVRFPKKRKEEKKSFFLFSL